MESFLLDLSVVLVACAALSFLAVVFKQPIIISYILCGVVLGPGGFHWIRSVDFLESVSHIGITLLLFLAGLCLHPQKLIRLFRKTVFVTLSNCAFSFLFAFSAACLFGFSLLEAVCIGLALMFSSTILVVKLLPTTTLHQQRMGALCIGVLILQDLLAVVVLAFIRSLGVSGASWGAFVLLFGKLLLFMALLGVFEQFVLRRIMMRVERLHEMLFILGLAWCFGAAGISNKLGLFYETGAFFAGVAIARHPVSLFISERLKPLRDFFLVLFFFALGAKFDLMAARALLVPALTVASVFILVKPLLFKRMFILMGEHASFSEEIGFRLGQLSEFSLLIGLLSFTLGQIGGRAFQLIEFVTILTLILSSYLVVWKYPTPIGTSEHLIKD